MDPRLDALQQRLGHRFGDPALLKRALTHRSFGADHNERLEFLGDAVLSLVDLEPAVRALRRLRRRRPDPRARPPGARGQPAPRGAAARPARSAAPVGEGEARGGGAQRASILADALEALIGATFLDGGFDAARALVQRLFGEVIATTDVASWSKDAKTELQEWLQARRLPVPSYRIVAHARPGACADLRGRVRGAGARAWPSRARAARAAPPSRRRRAACSMR